MEISVKVPIHVKVFAVKKVAHEIYEDVGLKGALCYDMINGEAEISGIKFITTSYHCVL